jgi:hypothetical protein
LEVKWVMTRDDLLKIVQENKVRHAEMREDALKGSWEQAAAACEEAVDKLSKGAPAVSIRMYLPEDHTADYDRAIRMLEMTTQTEIELNEHDFATLVDDDWDWARSWVASNKRFSKTVSDYESTKGW